MQFVIGMRAVILVLGLFVSSPVFAQPPSMTPTTEPAPAVLADAKSENVGSLLAIAGTAAPVLMFVAMKDSDAGSGTIWLLGASTVLLPSAGHWYAGKFFTTGMALRALGLTGTVLGIGMLVASEGDAKGAEGLALVGLGTLVVGGFYDIATASSAVEDWNRKHARVMPTALKMGDGYGVGLVGRF